MTTGQKTKKGHWLKEAKAKADAVDALLKEHGVESVEALNEMFRAMAAGPQVDTAVKVSGPPVGDPLDWITADCPRVGLVSHTNRFVLRGSNKSVYPHITRIAVGHHRTAPWAACPFYIGDRDNYVLDQNLKVWKEKWHHIVISRNTAENVWRDERVRKPTHTVISTESFEGWDPDSNAPRGVMEEITEFVPLREIVRRLLQKTSGTFLDWLATPPGFTFNRRYPNPYRNAIPGVVLEFKHGKLGD